MSETSIKIVVTFEKRPDGGLRVWSADVPGLVLSHADIDGVLDDVRTAIEVILSERLGQSVAARPLVDIREMLEEGGIVAPKAPTEPGTREYVAYVN